VGTVDCVLLSHLHADHTDIPTLRSASRSGPLIAPHGSREWLTAQGLENLRELRPGDECGVCGLRVQATSATHDPRRRPFGPAAAPIGFVIRGSSSIYFAGDTDIFPEMAELNGSIDVALLPVWGWGLTLGPGHLNPESAAAAMALIGPKVAIPIHWGTFALRRPLPRPPDPQRPAKEFAKFAAGYAPAVEVPILAPGDRIAL
jgi:L-ascorbate metabolism protein UlaG (beta-lactamase superfamily)